jgi:hypothetical protein
MVGKRVGRNLRLLSSIALTLAAAVVVVLAVGATAGRWRVWPVRAEGAGTGVGHDAALVLVPVPALQVDVGDRIVMGRDHARPALYRVDEIIDTVDGRVRVRDDHGKSHDVTLPARVWRMSRDLPYAGIPMRLLAGPIQAPVLVGIGIVVIARAESRRNRLRRGPAPAEPVAEPSLAGSQLREASR